ncbi:MAG: hypothetical protein RI897_551 [Verrucomicrobiota bacterium]|jgi:hypothetical protein
MDQPPQHPIEPQLQAWAKTRRLQCGSPFELHPADRRQLQQEIQQTYQHSAPLSTQPAWRLLLPRLALITAATAVFVFAIVHWMPDTSPEPKLAQASQPTETIPDLPPLEKASKLPAMGVAALNSEPPADHLALAADTMPPQPVSMEVSSASALSPLEAPAGATPTEIAPAPKPKSAAQRQDTQLSRPSNIRSKSAALVEPAALAMVEDAVRPAQARTPTQPLPPPDWTAKFRRQQPVARRNLNAPSYPILQSFQVEQRGNALRIIDGDGSVYSGETTAESPTAPPLNNALTQNYRFSLSGTHQSSRRAVQFEGLLENTIPPQIQGRASLDQRDRIVIQAASQP